MKKSLKVKLNEIKGITLVALVVTIILLIILATVTIYLSLGEDGLIKKAEYATKQYANAQTKEETEIAKISNKIDEFINGESTGGGATDGGATDGGATDGGATDGGATDGGATGGESTGGESTDGEYVGGSTEGIVSDYTTNMLYKTDYANMKDGENGVTLPSQGVTINGTGNYITMDGTGFISIDSDIVDNENKLDGTSDKTMTLWYRTNTNDNAERWMAGYGIHTNVGGAITIGQAKNQICNAVGYGKCDRYIDPADRYDGKWHFLVVVHTGGNKVRLYFDNIAFESTGTYNTTEGDLTIGRIL